MVQRADEVAPQGRKLHATKGHRAVLRMPLGMRLGITPRLQHYQDNHAVTVRTLVGRMHCVMVLAQEGGQPLLLPLLTQFQRIPRSGWSNAVVHGNPAAWTAAGHGTIGSTPGCSALYQAIRAARAGGGGPVERSAEGP